MDIKFPDGLDFRARALMEAIPLMLAEIPERAREDAAILKQTIDRIHVRVTGGNTWRFEASGFGVLYASKRAFECLWIFVYAHLQIYCEVLSGKRIAGGIDLEQYPNLRLPREMLAWLHSDAARRGARMPEHFPIPDPNVERESPEGLAFRLTLHAIRFHVFHELAHLVFARKSDRPDDLLEEERACDLQAVRWMNSRAAVDYKEHEGTKTGAAMGLLYLAAFGIDTGRHDGVTHPRSYDRLVETLNTVYGAKEDRVWGVVVTVLAAHCWNMNIKFKWPDGGFDEFRAAALFARDSIEKYVDDKVD